MAKAARQLQSSAAGSDSITVNPYIKELLHLPPRTNLHGHALVKKGDVFMQDLSSCLPVAALAPPPGATVVDACAAPGNKTTMLAARVGSGGRVVAFERSSVRAEALRTTIRKAGAADIIATVEEDFTESSPQDERWHDATMVLCDPSCSGTGDAERSHPSQLAADTRLPREKVAALAADQKRIVLHAMRLPCVRVVVYSTCSVLREENEDVVEAVLREASEWRVAACLPDWPQRGQSAQATENSDEDKAAPSDVDSSSSSSNGANKYSIAAACIRASRAQQTGGFFVCRFEKADSAAGDSASSKSGSKKKKRKKNRKKRKATADKEAEVSTVGNTSAATSFKSERAQEQQSAPKQQQQQGTPQQQHAPHNTSQQPQKKRRKK